MSAQDDFQFVVGDVIAPYLKERGFRRTKSTFRRRAQEGWQIINLQKDKWSREDHVRFTVNLGVALDALTDDPSPRASRGWPMEYDCHFRHRLAGKSGREVWESLGRWRDRKSRTARRIVEDLEAHGLPWLELHADPERLLASIGRAPDQLDMFDSSAFLELAALRGSVEEQAAAKQAVDLAVDRAFAAEGRSRDEANG